MVYEHRSELHQLGHTQRHYLVAALKLSDKENQQRRAEILANLEAKLDSPIISYMDNLDTDAFMCDSDSRYLVEMLNNIDLSKGKIHLILHSHGGDFMAASQYSQLFRETFPKEFNIIVPSTANSAATMLTLSADKAVMGPGSVLGPIDPQICKHEPDSGQHIYLPAKLYMATIKSLEDSLRRTEDEEMKQLQHERLDKMDMTFARKCEALIIFVKSISQRLLREGLMKGRDEEEIKNTIEQLMGAGKYAIHESTILASDARNLRLNVETWDQNDEKWQLLWEYYNLVETLFKSRERDTWTKLFETKDYPITCRHPLESGGETAAEPTEQITEQSTLSAELRDKHGTK